MIINENKTFTIKAYGEEMTMRLRKGEYACPKNTAIMLDCETEYGWEPYENLTVNISPLPKDYAAIDKNNLSDIWSEIEELIKDNDLGEFTRHEFTSGFCKYHILKLNMQNIDKFCEGGM